MFTTPWPHRDTPVSRGLLKQLVRPSITQHQIHVIGSSARWFEDFTFNGAKFTAIKRQVGGEELSVTDKMQNLWSRAELSVLKHVSAAHISLDVGRNQTHKCWHAQAVSVHVNCKLDHMFHL